MRTFKNECELLAKKLSLKYEHLLGRTEIYLSNFVDDKTTKELFALQNKGMKLILLTRTNNGIVAVLDYTSDMFFNQQPN